MRFREVLRINNRVDNNQRYLNWMILPVVFLLGKCTGFSNELHSETISNLNHVVLIFQFILLFVTWFLDRVGIMLTARVIYEGGKIQDRLIVYVAVNIINLLISCGIVYGVYLFLATSTMIVQHIKHEIPATIIYLILLNLIYAVLYINQERKGKQMPVKEKQNFLECNSKIFEVKINKRCFYIEADEIAIAYKDCGITYINTWNGKKIIMDHSLRKLQELLPGNVFFYANRKCIINRRLIAGYKRLETRNLQLNFNENIDFQEDVTINKNRVSEFKNWLTP